MSREYSIKPLPGVQVGDSAYYANGTEYVITDHGPNMWGSCFLCGAPAAAIPTMKLSAVRCGKCLLEEFDMQPGGWVYEAKAAYAAAFRAARPTRGPRSEPRRQ